MFGRVLLKTKHETLDLNSRKEECQHDIVSDDEEAKYHGYMMPEGVNIVDSGRVLYIQTAIAG